MALGTAKEEIAKSDELWKDSNFTALRKQQEKAFGYFGPYKFEMDKKEGAWDEVTTNSPKIIANKILGLLSTSWLQLYIDVDDETREERKEISNTEQLANGAIWASDRALTSVPSGKSIQSALSFFASIKGGIAQSFLWVEKDGLVVPKGRVYDPEFCQWIEGEEELLWFCYRNYVSKAFIKQAYKKQIEEGKLKVDQTGTTNQILTYTFFDENDWKVAIGDEYVDEGEHGLGYVPVNIRSCGAVPYIQSDGTYSDTMKWSWQNVFGSDWEMIDLESKLLSIETSKALESGKIKIAGEWDSEKSGNRPPEGLEKLGYSPGSDGSSSGRNEIVLFDAAKGQKFGGMVQPPTNEIVERLAAKISTMLRLSNIDPIAFGQMTRSGSGILAAELRAAAMEFINPFRKCVEEAFIWRAEECVRQFKNGDFGKITLEGVNARRQKFYLEDITPKDVEEKHFECKLVPDRLRDEIQELGAAIQKVQAGLSSRRTAMVKHNLVEDPDLEINKMEEELASQDPVFKNDKLAKYFKDLGTPEGDKLAQYFMALSAIQIEKTIKQAMMEGLMPSPTTLPGGDGQRKAPIGMPLGPEAEVGRLQAQAGKLIQ